TRWSRPSGAMGGAGLPEAVSQPDCRKSGTRVAEPQLQSGERIQPRAQALGGSGKYTSSEAGKNSCNPASRKSCSTLTRAHNEGNRALEPQTSPTRKIASPSGWNLLPAWLAQKPCFP